MTKDPLKEKARRQKKQEALQARLELQKEKLEKKQLQDEEKRKQRNELKRKQKEASVKSIEPVKKVPIEKVFESSLCTFSNSVADHSYRRK